MFHTFKCIRLAFAAKIEINSSIIHQNSLWRALKSGNEPLYEPINVPVGWALYLPAKKFKVDNDVHAKHT